MVWMNVVDRARMRIALRHHYQRQVDPVGDEAIDALVSAMVAEDSRARGGAESRRGFLPFVVAQARFIPIWVWLAQVALVATMVLVARLAGNGVMARWAIGVMSTASVLVCVPTLHSSRLHGVVELECSCRHNAASVLVARLIVLGCSASLCLGGHGFRYFAGDRDGGTLGGALGLPSVLPLVCRSAGHAAQVQALVRASRLRRLDMPLLRVPVHAQRRIPVGIWGGLPLGLGARLPRLPCVALARGRAYRPRRIGRPRWANPRGLGFLQIGE